MTKKKNEIKNAVDAMLTHLIAKKEESWHTMTPLEKLQKILDSNTDKESKEKWSFLYSLSEEAFTKCLGFRVDISSLGIDENKMKYVKINIPDFSFIPFTPSTFSIFYEIKNAPLTEERKEKIRSHEKLHELLTTYSEDGDDYLQPRYELIVEE